MTFEDAVVIRATPRALFDLTQDYARRLEWDPFLRSAELVGGATRAGMGVRAYCVAHNRLGMETEYVSFNPPSVAAVRMTRGPWFIGGFAGSWRFRPQADGRTRVIFRYSVRARPAWIQPLLNPILVRVFSSEVRQRLEGLRDFVERTPSRPHPSS
ncbi:SRPBCC family protein [Longimicrobium sp.]|uniref:type II toxin-antitoxin system RatA family toxin n=1 Tax=Longimicrobium sp. TaxID=2029185 RepID=UPI002E31510C|nr:SRPBCC family protein [Longimicrobium sp.]HEX6042335.1 SRPBCC family protein [Longimicrobium sp.]